MSVLNRYNKLVSSVFRSRVLLEQTGVFRGVGSVPKTRCHNLNLTGQLIGNFASCHNRGCVFTCHRDTKRCFSELYNENKNSQTCEVEPHEMDSESK